MNNINDMNVMTSDPLYGESGLDPEMHVNAEIAPGGGLGPQPVVRPVHESMHESLQQRRLVMERRCTQAARSIGRSVLVGLTTSLVLQCVPIPRDCKLDATGLHAVASTHARRLQDKRHDMVAHVWKPLRQGDWTRINQHVNALHLFQVWAQMSRYLTLESLIALGDAIITAEAKRTGKDATLVYHELESCMLSMPRFMGKRRCRKALRFVRTHVDSLQETDCRITFERHGIPCPETGYAVPGFAFKSGADMTLDMAWAEYKVAVEHDGDHHRTNQAQWRRDKEKRDRLRAHGWIIITVTAANLASDQARAELAFEVARALALRGARFTFHVVALSLDEL